jgi:PleD family two-component response regulator
LKSDERPYEVLIIGNYVPQLESLQSTLIENGFLARILNSEIDKLDTIQQINPDVIILYFNRSNNDEISICKMIREDTNIPVLVVASDNKTGMVEKTLDAGADEYLVKPISEKVLFAYIKTLSRRSRFEEEAKNNITEHFPTKVISQN